MMIANVRADLPGNSNIYVAAGASYIGADGVVDSKDLDDDDFSGNLRLGYLFGSFIGAEIGYLKLGDFNSDSLSVDVDAYTAAIVVNAPIGLIDLYGKFGVARVDGEVKIDNLLIDDFSIDGSSTEPFVAVGGEFDTGPLNVFIEFARVDTDFNVDINVFSIGLKIEI